MVLIPRGSTMANFGLLLRSAIRASTSRNTAKACISSSSAALNSGKGKLGLAALGFLGAGGVTVLYALENAVEASDLELHPQKLPWSHRGLLDALDMASVRRGYFVYKQVCAACHSMKFLSYRHFVNVFLTEEEAKAEAAEALIDDIDDDGKSIQRPGGLTDYLPKPYPNKKAAEAANSGAEPPDLTLIAEARHGHEDYIFSLLTSYTDTPAGIKVDEGKAYNVYFPGGVLAMPQQLFDDGVEFDDGTPATISQQAKDVCTFFRWSVEPYHDTRKRWGLKIALIMIPISIFLLYFKRHVFAFQKTRKFVYQHLPSRLPPTKKT